MNIIRGSDLVERPWRNGGGITREIVEVRDGTDLLWRLSMADVASDGPFSDFSGLMRVLTVIEGGAMELSTPVGVLMAEPLKPVRFDGGLAVTSKLLDGPLRDLNLMFDPLRVAGNVEVIEASLALTATPQQSYALHMLAGAAELGAQRMAKGDTVGLEAGTGTSEIALATASAALLISLKLI